jgi:hypothetical protein
MARAYSKSRLINLACPNHLKNLFVEAVSDVSFSEVVARTVLAAADGGQSAAKILF